MNDLTLIPLEDLLKELENRCTCFIAAYTLPKEQNFNMKFYYGNSIWSEAVKLSSILNNDVLNNWKGELKTLQKLNDSYEDKETF